MGRFRHILLALALVACGPAPSNETTPASRGRSTLLLRNHSHETVCYVLLAPSDAPESSRDHLGPAEVVLPGGGRDWDLPPGRYDLRLQDCNRSDLMVRDGMAIDADGVVVTFRQRE